MTLTWTSKFTVSGGKNSQEESISGYAGTLPDETKTDLNLKLYVSNSDTCFCVCGVLEMSVRPRVTFSIVLSNIKASVCKYKL